MKTRGGGARGAVALVWGTAALLALLNLHFLSQLYPMRRSFFDAIRTTYNANTLYLPVLCLVAGALGVALLPRAARRSRRLAVLLLILAAAGPALRWYATHYEPHHLVIRRVEIETPKVDREVRILHITDIQSDRVGAWDERIFRAMGDLDPHLVVFTGDLLQPLPPSTLDSELPKMEALLSRLHPLLGVVGVYGDTDRPARAHYRQGVDGLDFMDSDTREFLFGGTRIVVFGMTLEESVSRPSAAMEAEVRSASEAFVVLAGHVPDYALSTGGWPVDLRLAGHTHGGQIRVPGWGPLVTLSNVPKAWARGVRELNHGWLNVSAGLGCEHAGRLPDIRFFCPPEMTLITLKPSPLASTLP